MYILAFLFLFLYLFHLAPAQAALKVFLRDPAVQAPSLPILHPPPGGSLPLCLWHCPPACPLPAPPTPPPPVPAVGSRQVSGSMETGVLAW